MCSVKSLFTNRAACNHIKDKCSTQEHLIMFIYDQNYSANSA